MKMILINPCKIRHLLVTIVLLHYHIDYVVSFSIFAGGTGGGAHAFGGGGGGTNLRRQQRHLHLCRSRNNGNSRTGRNNVNSRTGSVLHVQKQTQKETDQNGDSNSNNEGNQMDLLTKSSWYAFELFGKAFGTTKNKNESKDKDINDNGKSIDNAVDVDTKRPPKSVEETLQRIKLDNDRAYFLNGGQMDVLIYDEQCLFGDPFVAFRGRDRFVENLSNLGSFITKYDVKILKENTKVIDSERKQPSSSTQTSTSATMTTTTTRFMVKLQLNLPWKPILAWPWGVTYEIDPQTKLVVSHIESWDIEPLEGVKQIFRKPTTSI